MNVLLIIVISAFTGTTFMTLFSYLLSYIFQTQFKEPVLLRKLLENSAAVKKSSVNSVAGWLLHYGAGIMFVSIYYVLWNFAGLRPSVLNGALLGLASGFFGVGVWWMVFNIHNNPPLIDRTGYFLHLIIVHVIFGIGATTCYYFLED